MEVTRRSSSVRQLEMLVEFAEGHRDLALGRLRSKEARELSKRLWRECAETLNSEGPARNHKEWTKVWNDMKCRVRTKLSAMNQSHYGTGGGPKSLVSLSALEERVANIIGRDVGPLLNVAQDPFVATSEDNVLSEEEVRLEIIDRHSSNENPQQQEVLAGPSRNSLPYVSPSQQSSPPLRPSQQPSPPILPPTESIPISQASTPRRGRGRRPRRSRRSAPGTPRASRIHTQAQTSRVALDESRAMVMRIEELRANTDQMLAQSALRQAEAAKLHAEAAKGQAEAALIAANAEKVKAETLAAFLSTVSPLVPAVLQSLLNQTQRMSSEEQ